MLALRRTPRARSSSAVFCGLTGEIPVEAGDPGLYVHFFMIEQSTLALLPDRGGAGDLLYSIADALPPEWTESYPDWERTSEALRELVEGLPPTEALLDRYPDAVYTLYNAWGQWPKALPTMPVTPTTLTAAKTLFDAAGIAECARILDWTRGSPLLPAAPVTFPRFSYLTVEELGAAKPASIKTPSQDEAVASLCNSVVAIVNEAREQSDCGVYATFEMHGAAEEGVEADEA